MSSNLENIIEKIYGSRELPTFGDKYGNTLIDMSGKILSELFKNKEQLDSRSKIFLECNNSIDHIYNILKGLKEKSIKECIKEEKEKIYEEISKDKKISTLYSIMYEIIDSNEEENNDVIVEKIIKRLFEDRVNGKLDEDTRQFTYNKFKKEYIIQILTLSEKKLNKLMASVIKIINKKDESDKLEKSDKIEEIKEVAKFKIKEIKEIHSRIDHLGIELFGKIDHEMKMLSKFIVKVNTILK
jgi:hypothetical protein